MVTAGLRCAPLNRPSGLRATATMARPVTIATNAMRPDAPRTWCSTGLSGCHARTRALTSTAITIATPTSSASGATDRQVAARTSVGLVSEGPDDRVGDIRVERAHVIIGQPAEQDDRAAELLHRRHAAGALGQVTVDRRPLLGGEAAVEQIGDALDQVAAGDIVEVHGSSTASSVRRTALRPRCSSTRSLPPLSESALQTSGD